MQNVSICPGTGVTLVVEKVECLEKRLNSFSLYQPKSVFTYKVPIKFSKYFSLSCLSETWYY